MENKNGLFDWKHLKLWRLSSLAEFFSKILLIVYILIVIGQIFQYNQWSLTQNSVNLLILFSQKPYYILYTLIPVSGTALQGIFYYVVLKSVALGLSMIVETDINYRDKRADEGEIRLLENQNQPGLYESEKVLNLKVNINRLAIWVIVVNVCIGVLETQFVKAFLQGAPVSFVDSLQSLPNELSMLFSIGLQIAITYFILNALAYILQILMDMEFNSRNVK